MASTQTLSDSDRRELARWAAECAERVLPLFDGDATARRVLEDALERTRAYHRGESSAKDEIRRRFEAVRAAKSAVSQAGAAAAQSVAQASAVAHMGAHALGAAAYAVKAISLVHSGAGDAEVKDRTDHEIEWQLSILSEQEKIALKLLPKLGTDSSGPLGNGLLSQGVLGATIREIQERIKRKDFASNSH